MRQNSKIIRWMSHVATTSVFCFATFAASASRIEDITRISGQMTDNLTGIGLVTGLKGTGDGGEFSAAIKPLAALLTAYRDDVDPKELADVQNIALVGLHAKMPKDGAHRGDKIDVYVTSWGKASTLKGGFLNSSPLTGPRPTMDSPVWAMATGAVLLEDPSSPTVGVIKGGGVIQKGLKRNYITNGILTLVVEAPFASFTTATAIANQINESEANGKEPIATVPDPKTIEVVVPLSEREHPDAFIGRIQRLQVPDRLMSTEARVMINERTKQITMSGNVEISPGIISIAGLTIISTSPRREATERNPITSTKDFIPIDPANVGGTRLQDLVSALDQLKVPAEDRISIIKELHKTGLLHAKLETSNDQ